MKQPKFEVGEYVYLKADKEKRPWVVKAVHYSGKNYWYNICLPSTINRWTLFNERGLERITKK